MQVLVIGYNGQGLMPCKPARARHLVKAKKAAIVNRHPFTIRLLYKTGCAHLPVSLGMDTGSQHVGMGITSENRVLDKSEHILRSTMEKRALLETRKAFRRGRRYRNTPYRHPKFKARTKRVYTEKLAIRKKIIIINGKPATVTIKSHWSKEKICFGTNRQPGWLPPSMQSKLDQHTGIMNAYAKALPDDTGKHIEAARFDIAKIKDPGTSGTGYQTGQLYMEENIKAYVFSRDSYKCKCCGAKAGSIRRDGTTVKLRAHHIDFRAEGATDNPDRMVSVCDRCHTAQAHAPGGILYQWMLEGKKMRRGYRDMTMLNIIVKRLCKTCPDACFTYGNITNADRKMPGLEKSHANDAVAIAMHGLVAGTGKIEIADTPDTTIFRQVRRKKRSLHEANPRRGIKEPNQKALRNAKNTKCQGGLYINDSVMLDGKKGWVQSFAGTHGARIMDPAGQYIVLSDKYPQVPIGKVKFMHHNHNWRVYTQQQALSPIHPGNK